MAFNNEQFFLMINKDFVFRVMHSNKSTEFVEVLTAVMLPQTLFSLMIVWNIVGN